MVEMRIIRCKLNRIFLLIFFFFAYFMKKSETCNGCYCDSWVEYHWNHQPDKPAFWTEDAEALRYELYGYATVERPPEDVGLLSIIFPFENAYFFLENSMGHC